LNKNLKDSAPDTQRAENLKEVREMADEEKQQQEGEEEESKPKKKGKSKLLIIIIAAVVLLGGGGFFAYTKFFAKPKPAEAEQQQQQQVKEEQPVLFALDPFVVNLSERGRFLKCTMQLELIDKSYEDLAKEKTPPIRDAIITLISSKTADSITTPEGKFQLKDEILMRANAAVGKDIFKNVYFTEFVMQ